jgi:phospholipase/lecithinase/hemolysin
MCNGPIWPEFLSTNLGLAYIASHNFAASGASSGAILNQQVLPFHTPADASSALFVLGAAYENDFLNLDPNTALQNLTNNIFWANFIRELVGNTSNSVAALYRKGARTIVVPDMSDFSLLPYVNGVPQYQLDQISGRCTQLNLALRRALDAIDAGAPNLRLFQLNFHDRFSDVIAHYSDYGLSKITVSALGDTNLVSKAYDGPGKDYAFWDDVHPTSKMHILWSDWMRDLVTQGAVERLSVSQGLGSGQITVNAKKLSPARTYTLQMSLNLKTWSDLDSVTTAEYTNAWGPLFMGGASTFYRLVGR